MIRLQCEGVVVLLPNPALGNEEANTDELDIKRTMAGGVYTYVRRRTPRVLSYTFDLSRIKYYELLSFYSSYCANVIQLLDWKGSLYYGFLQSDTLEVSQNGRGSDICSWGNIVDLEFEMVSP